MAAQCPAEFAGDDVESIKELQDYLDVAMKSMEKQVLHEDVAILIGTTKSGKSTLINYLLDNSLVGVKQSRILPNCIQKADNAADTGPQIGSCRKSETIIPTRWENPRRLPGLAIWDTPGFDDNRGKIQDIINAFYVHKLFERIKSVKIVLVTNIQHVMNEPINPFLDLLKSVENLLQEKMKDCFSSIVVIFTKVDQRIQIDDNLLAELLQPIWTNDSLDMSSTSRDFVRYLTQHNQNVGFFKQPSVGPITDTIEVGITEAIQRATSVPEDVLKDVLFPSIVDTSKVFLYKCRDKISCVTKFNELQTIVCEALDDIFHGYSELQMQAGSRDLLCLSLDDLIARQSQINQVLDSGKSFCQKLKDLEKIHPKIETAINRDHLVEKSKLMEFIDKLLDLKECEHFDFSLQSVMATAKSKINELITTIHLKLNQIDGKEADRKLQEIFEEYQKTKTLLTQQLEYIKKYNQERNMRGFGGLCRFAGKKINKWVLQPIKKYSVNFLVETEK